MPRQTAPEALPIQERILAFLALGESQFREFKSTWEGPPGEKRPRDPKAVAADVAEALVAFANADGGVLLVGVEDDGTVTGISYDADRLQVILDAPVNNVHKGTPLPPPTIRDISIDTTRILYFSVEKSTRLIHQTSSGRCLQRRDLENAPVAFDQLQFERQEQVSREYDRSFVDGASVLDLDVELIRRVSDHIARGMSPEKCLQLLALADFSASTFQLRRAALLLFAKDISRWHPRCEVRLLRVRGTELRTGREYNALSDEIATGNILQLLSVAWEKLRPHLVETKLAPDALFKERVMYPEDACREALINAVAHRDYSIEGRGIEILIFDDRMEVHSPGGLLSTVRIEELRKLQGLHQSRNALVARTLREIGYMREMGEGLRRIFKLMNDADLVSPELRSESSRFSIMLSHKSVFSDTDQRWLDGFSSVRLTREEMLIALMGSGGQRISALNIYERLGLVDWDVYRVIVDQMMAKGVLHNTQQRGKARSGQRRREVKRYAIRKPEEIERGISEVLGACSVLGPVDVLSFDDIKRIVMQLPKPCIYHQPFAQFDKVLRALHLMDDRRRPTEILRGVWKARAAVSVHGQTPAGMEEGGRPVALRPVSLSRRVSDGHESRKIYIGNLPNDITRADLIAFLEPCGSVVWLEMPLDYVTNRGRGFAFARMSSNLEALKVVQQLNGCILGGRVARIGWGKPAGA